jgi:hypothetical protein
VYDLVERLFPAEVLAARVPEDEQRLHRMLSRFRGNGLLGASGNQELWIGTYRRPGEKAELRGQLLDRGDIVPVAVEGLRTERYVLRDEGTILDQAEREVGAGSPPGGSDPSVAFLAPLDPFCWDRDLLRRLFAFDYLWEVYVPEPKRRWGYYVLPILYGDRLVGRIEPRIERRAGVLNVINVWWEAGFDPVADPGFARAFAAAIAAHQAFADAQRVTLPRFGPSRGFMTEVRAILGR